MADSPEPGDRILCFGPYGNPTKFIKEDTRQNLLIVADSERFLALLSIIHRFLDRGGRVTLLLLRLQSNQPHVQELIQALPLLVEIQESGNLEPSQQLINLFRWADLLITAIQNRYLPPLVYHIQSSRFQTSSSGRKSAAANEFGYAFVEADYLCGYGACLACTVPTASGGLTRACMHGPILPLSTLAG